MLSHTEDIFVDVIDFAGFFYTDNYTNYQRTQTVLWFHKEEIDGQLLKS